MAFIKCPECGHTALSVASTCPSCGHLLVQNPMQTTSDGTGTCRKCGKQVARTDAVCPFCGHLIGRWRTVRTVGIAMAGALVVTAGTVLFVVARRASGPTEVREEVVGLTAVTTEHSAPPAAAGDTVDAAPPIAPMPPPPEPTTAPRAAPAGSLRSRWTANWVNVREGPGTANPIVGVLRPGTPVRVGEFRRGWWAVYDGDTLLGWAAGDLLVEARPDSV